MTLRELDDLHLEIGRTHKGMSKFGINAGLYSIAWVGMGDPDDIEEMLAVYTESLQNPDSADLDLGFVALQGSPFEACPTNLPASEL